MQTWGDVGEPNSLRPSTDCNGDPYCTKPRSFTVRNGQFEKVDGSYTTPVFDITVGYSAYPACLLAQNGLYCWDAGNPSSTPRRIPTLRGRPTTEILSIQAHNDNICGVFTDGHVYCWTGINGNGSLSNVTEITQVYKLINGSYF